MNSLGLDQRIEGLHAAVDGKPPEQQGPILDAIELYDPQLRRDLGQRLGSLMTQLVNHDHFTVTIEEVALHEPEQMPTAEIKSSESKSDDSKIIQAATDLHTEFLALPETQRVKAKHKNRRDRNFILKRLERLNSSGEGESSPGLLSQPHAIATTLETWIALAHDDGERSEILVDVATQALTEYARDNWAEIPTTTIAGLLQESVHSTMATSALEEILNGYCKGPRNQIDQVTMYADLCLTAQYFLDDQQTIDRLAQIAGCITEVLPQRGVVHAALLQALMNVADIELYETAAAATGALDSIHALSSFDESSREWVKEGLSDLSDEYTQQIHQLMRQYNCSISNAQEIFDTRITLLGGVTQAGGSKSPSRDVETIREAYGSEVADWYGRLRFGLSARKREYLETFGHRANRSNHLKRLDERFGKIIDIVSLPIDDGDMLDVFIPEGRQLTIENYHAIRRKAVQAKKSFRNEPAQSSIQNIDLKNGSILSATKVDGQDLLFAVRPSCKLDGLTEHSLNQLLWQDLPDIESELFATAEGIAKRIDRYEQRYIGKRGIKTKFKSDEMTAAGFEEMTIKEDPRNPNSLMVALQHHGTMVRYRINSRMQLDLENRRIHSTRLQKIIERRTLAVIEEFMTREVMETSEGTIRGLERGTTARSDGLVYLPEGQNFRPKQWELYLEKRKKDLRIKSILRKPDDPTGKGRNSTYRQATEVDDPTAEPLEVYIEDKSIV